MNFKMYCGKPKYDSPNRKFVCVRWCVCTCMCVCVFVLLPILLYGL